MINTVKKLASYGKKRQPTSIVAPQPQVDGRDPGSRTPQAPQAVAPQMRNIGAGMGTPQAPQAPQAGGQPNAVNRPENIRGKSFFEDPLGKIKEVGRAVAKPVEKAGKWVGQATGFEAQDPIGDEFKPKTDPTRVDALGEYGKRVTEQQEQYDPSKYGPGYFKANEYTPQTTTPGVPMPGARQEQALERDTNQIQRPDEGAIAAQLAKYGQRTPSQVATEGQSGSLDFQQMPGMPSLQREEASNVKFNQEGGHGAPVRPSEQGQGPRQLAPETGQSLGTRSMEANQQLPQMQGEAGSRLDMQQVQSMGPNVGGYEDAVKQEMGRLGSPQQTQAGFDPGMRDKAMQLATSGMDMQKQQAMAKMKEEQMASGNFGSSVGQRQMAEMGMQYDRMATDAGLNIDIQGMGAEREDRYRNAGLEQNRVGQVQSLAGQGAGMATGAADFARSGVSMDNQAQQIMEEYARQGRTIDNATAMQMAQFQREGRGTDYVRGADEAQFDRQGRQIDQSTEERLAQYGREGRGIDFNADMQSGQFDREGRQIDNQGKRLDQQFDREGREINRGVDEFNANLSRQDAQINNSNMMQGAQFDREGRQIDRGREDAGSATGYNRARDLAQYGRDSRSMDYGRDQDQQNNQFNQGMQVNQFDREGRGINYGDERDRYDASTNEARYADANANQANMFNVGQEDARQNNEMNAYNQSLSRLGNYGSDQLTPESKAAYEMETGRQADQQGRAAATMGMVGTAVGGYLGGPAGAGMVNKLKDYGKRYVTGGTTFQGAR